ncbi:MAG: pyridoxamine 5'-phosphate oxidase family protein, partial [Alphaproteobacteria bacterium]|nr:pyridoxamine 5'-phosphate oxidase family protein [Alphaproteobacteria bacterium]
DLWNPDNKVQKGDFPTLGKINQDWYGVDADETDARLANDYENNLY